MTTDHSHETRLSPYQEAIRLSTSIELQKAIQSAHVKIWKDPTSQIPSREAKRAYWGAVETLLSANIPLSDDMVHDDLQSLKKLSLQLETETDQAA